MIPTHQDLKKRILVVDDHAFIRQGVRDFLEREDDLFICGEASGRVEALEFCAGTDPHLVLIDLTLGLDSGLDLVKDIVAQFSRVKILVLSMQDEMLYAERVLRAGASGYISKNVHPAQLIEAVRCVLGGGVYVSEVIRQRSLKMARRSDPGCDPVGILSDRELEVFKRIGKGQSTADIAAALHVNVKTVDTYRLRIKRKLGLRNVTELVQQSVQWIFDNKV